MTDTISQKSSIKSSLLAVALLLAAPLYAAAQEAAEPEEQGPPEIELTWRDNSTNEDGWIVERKVDGGAFEDYATIATQTRLESGVQAAFLDTAVQPGHIYSYRIRAFNEFGLSGYTNVAEEDLPGPPNGDPSDAESSSGPEPRKILRFEVLDNGQVNFLPLAP